MSSTTSHWLFMMEFPQRLTRLRKERGHTQKALAESVSVHVTQIQRYENGSTQPTLTVIRKLAVALSISADVLVFGKDERGPDDRLRFHFEAVSQLDPDEQDTIMEVIDGMLLKHDAKRRLVRASS